jgi:ornithine carbamoyltransferase
MTNITFSHKHLLGIEDLQVDEIKSILDATTAFKEISRREKDFTISPRKKYPLKSKRRLWKTKLRFEKEVIGTPRDLITKHPRK